MKETKEKVARKSQRIIAIRKSNAGNSPPQSDTKRPTRQQRKSNKIPTTSRTNIKKELNTSDDNGSNHSMDTFSSNLSEFMTSTEEEETDSDDDEHNYTYKKIEKSISTIFPLDTINAEEVTLIKCLSKTSATTTTTKEKEYTFEAKYNDLDVYCTCISPYNKDNTDNEYLYAYKMSEELLACRNMASYLGVFITHDLKTLVSSKTLTVEERRELLSNKQAMLFIIKPYFRNGTLADYLEQKRAKSDPHIESLCVIQMAITLFGMMSDAHDQFTALADISPDSLFVGDDDCLYFGGFQHAIFLDDTFPTHQKPWINIKQLVQACPEHEQLIEGTYKRSMDVFLACNLLLEIIKKPKKEKLFKKNHHRITIIKEAIDRRHLKLVEILEKGLSYDPKERPSASDILYWLETTRYKSLAATSTKRK